MLAVVAGYERERRARRGGVGVEAAKSVAIDIFRRGGLVAPPRQREVRRKRDALLGTPRAMRKQARLLRRKGRPLVLHGRARRRLLLRRRRRRMPGSLHDEHVPSIAGHRRPPINFGLPLRVHQARRPWHRHPRLPRLWYGGYGGLARGGVSLRWHGGGREIWREWRERRGWGVDDGEGKGGKRQKRRENRPVSRTVRPHTTFCFIRRPQPPPNALGSTCVRRRQFRPKPTENKVTGARLRDFLSVGDKKVAWEACWGRGWRCPYRRPVQPPTAIPPNHHTTTGTQATTHLPSTPTSTRKGENRQVELHA